MCVTTDITDVPEKLVCLTEEGHEEAEGKSKNQISGLTPLHASLTASSSQIQIIISALFRLQYTVSSRRTV